jgi:hypothetical protein
MYRLRLPRIVCTDGDQVTNTDSKPRMNANGHKYAERRACWRQGNLLHFGFQQSPAEMNLTGQRLLLRRELLDPFFKALGWDMDNEQGYAEAYKDVVHEDAIKVGEATKAPDDSFRIGGTRKSFISGLAQPAQNLDPKRQHQEEPCHNRRRLRHHLAKYLERLRWRSPFIAIVEIGL